MKKQFILLLLTAILIMPFKSDAFEFKAGDYYAPPTTASTADLNIIDGVSDSGTLTPAELLYVDGVTSGIQTQLDGKQTSHAYLTDLSGIGTPSDSGIFYDNSAGHVTTFTCGTGISFLLTVLTLDSTLSDISDGTIAEDLVNTDNPWADNEVADNLTISTASLEAQAASGDPAYFYVTADASEDNSDQWKNAAADGGNYTIESYESGAWVAVFTLSNTGALSSLASLNSTAITENSNAVPNSTDNLSFFAATTSAQLYGVLSDESGTGPAIFQTSQFISATATELGNADTTPDVSAAATKGNNFFFTNENGTITDFDDGDDHSEFVNGESFFILRVDDASTTIDFSVNANIEGNAGIDFTGSATQITYLLFLFEDSRWNCLNLNAGMSSPTALAVAAINMVSGTLAAPSGTNPTTDAQGEISLDESDVGQTPLFLEAYDEGVGDASRIIGTDIICESYTILEPDSAVSVEPNIPLKYFKSMGYPHGTTILGISVGTDGTDVTNDTINFERWTTEDDGSPDTIENIDMSGVDNKDDDGTLTNAAMAANDYFVADITGWDDDIPLLIISVCYRINPGD